MSRMTRKLKGTIRSLTIWFNSLLASLAVGLPALQEALPQLQSYLPDDFYKWLTAALIVGNVLIRFRTSTSLEDKNGSPPLR